MASKLITYAVFLGAIFGLFMGIVIIPIYDSCVVDFAMELTKRDLMRHNVPESEINTTLAVLKGELAAFKYWMPVAEMINLVIYGLIIGGIAHIFHYRVRLKEPAAISVAFLIVIGIYSLILYGVNVYYSGDFIPMLLKYVPLWYILLGVFGFFGLYIVLCSVRGPWDRWFMGGPKHY